jgi:YHS domain-containing protein
MFKATLLCLPLLALPLAGCESASQAAPTVAAPKSAAAVGDDPAVPRLAPGTKLKCPVSGESFTVTAKTAQVTYKGKRYAFCCPDCQPAFTKNPAKYVK